MLLTDTIAAIATPPGTGGIAVIRVSGPNALTIAAQVFQPVRKGSPASYRGYSVHYGRFVEPERGIVLDDGLITVFRAPASYTGENTVEFSCHGGYATAASLLHAVLAAGARSAGPGEFTYRAFINGKMDLAQAEAVSDLIQARGESMRRAAHRQMEGQLSDVIRGIRSELIGILAAIEVTIDFSEEVGELDYDALDTRIARARESLDGLARTASLGRVLREGLRVAIAGRPNVGKSSLLNALIGADRAIVTDIPGTTRDVIEEGIEIGGMPVVFVDTAGIRHTQDTVEKIGIQRARDAMQSADLILLMLDASTSLTDDDRTLLAATDESRTLAVLNKMDVAPADALRNALPDAIRSSACAVSALSGYGIHDLRDQIRQFGMGASTGGFESVVVTSLRHLSAIQVAQEALSNAALSAMERMPGDFVSIDVRGALDALGQITGETVDDAVIHRIFKDFCVGK